MVSAMLMITLHLFFDSLVIVVIFLDFLRDVTVYAKDASAVDAMEVLKMATVNGALAMGLKDADVLASGKLADLIMIDLNQPNMQPINNIPKNLVYSGSKQNVVMTMINGKILYEKGTFSVSETPETIYREAAAVIERIRKA